MDSVTSRTSKGATTRLQILKVAVDIASAEGLEGLAIGRLAGELEWSKSGLFGHFGSKEELQLSAVERARDVFVEEIITPAQDAERGRDRSGIGSRICVCPGYEYWRRKSARLRAVRSCVARSIRPG